MCPHAKRSLKASCFLVTSGLKKEGFRTSGQRKRWVLFLNSVTPGHIRGFKQLRRKTTMEEAKAQGCGCDVAHKKTELADVLAASEKHEETIRNH